MQPKLSIVMPVFNEGTRLAEYLHVLQPLRADCELLLVDGGSEDDGLIIAEPLVDKVVQSPRGRAKQMNAGAEQAKADM